MATTVGTGGGLDTLVRNYMLLEHDAIAAYEASIERIDAPDRKSKLAEFKSDHERHLDELSEIARSHGLEQPESGDFKQMLTTGKIQFANLFGGDGAILKAMSTNESDTISAYSNGLDNTELPQELRPLCERALADEKRHKEWMEAEAEAA